MKLLFDELRYINDGEILLNKINEAVASIREKGIGAEISPYHPMKYKDGELSLNLVLTVPARLPLREKSKRPKTFMESFKAALEG
jgi:hypothetical protein